MAVTVELADAPKAWVIDQRDDLWEAACELESFGFRGELSWAKPDPGSDSVFMLVLNSEVAVGVPEVRILIGDRLLLAGGVLRKLSPEEFAEVTA